MHKGKEKIKVDLKSSNKDKKRFHFGPELSELPEFEELQETPSYFFQVFIIF